MLEFFIALFGGIYTSGKVLAEKSELDSSRLICNKHAARLDAWKMQVVDRALEEDLWDYITKHENRESVWLEIRDAYSKMRFQKEYASADEWAFDGALDNTKAGRSWYRHHRFVEPLDILLAKHGKVRSERYFLPIAHLYRGEGQRTRLEWDRTVEFWKYIRDELRRHGVDAQLLFDHGYKTGATTKLYSNIDDVEAFRYQSGDLVWITDTRIGL